MHIVSRHTGAYSVHSPRVFAIRPLRPLPLRADDLGWALALHLRTGLAGIIRGVHSLGNTHGALALEDSSVIFVLSLCR